MGCRREATQAAWAIGERVCWMAKSSIRYLRCLGGRSVNICQRMTWMAFDLSDYEAHPHADDHVKSILMAAFLFQRCQGLVQTRVAPYPCSQCSKEIDLQNPDAQPRVWPCTAMPVYHVSLWILFNISESSHSCSGVSAQQRRYRSFAQRKVRI
jgi:hypothetical protein